MMAFIKNSSSKIRVLVVDDSALARKILTTGLSADRRIEVVGTASNPAAAFDMLVKMKPDVMTLDIEMPGMDGVTFLKKFMPVNPIPTVVVSSLAERGKKLALDALEAGAIDIVTKPKIGVADGLPLLVGDICDRVVAASRTDVSHYRRTSHQSADTSLSGVLNFSRQPINGHSGEFALKGDGRPIESNAMHETTDRVIAIGASAGGVATLANIIPMFPAGSPGIVIVQHMPGGFTTSFAARLNSLAKMQVKEAEHGDRVRSGLILLAPGGDYHMEVYRSGGEYRISLSDSEKVSGHRPSVDVLFNSVAKHVGRNAAAALLTGMGEDGAEGLLQIRNAGGRTFAQDEQTCVVFGMPAAAWKRGAAEMLLPIQDIPVQLLRAVNALGG
jgi:two-component system, chemotaxis family, protein-glutamate methylesterase/glutaminase